MSHVYILLLETNRIEDNVNSKMAIDIVKDLARERWGVQDTKIILATNGKPYFEYSENVKFNISHADGMTVIGMASEELGLDVEKVKPISPKIISKYYSDEEKNVIHTSQREQGCEDIKATEIWTRKEAHCKCIGEGITRETLLWNSFRDINFVTKSFLVGDYAISVCLKMQMDETQCFDMEYTRN